MTTMSDRQPRDIVTIYNERFERLERAVTKLGLWVVALGCLMLLTQILRGSS